MNYMCSYVIDGSLIDLHVLICNLFILYMPLCDCATMLRISYHEFGVHIVNGYCISECVSPTV